MASSLVLEESRATTSRKKAVSRNAEDASKLALVEANQNTVTVLALVRKLGEAPSVDSAIQEALDTIRSSFGWAYGSYWALSQADNAKAELAATIGGRCFC